MLQEGLKEIPYRALPADLIDEVKVDVGGMKVGDVIRVKDLAIMSDSKIVVSADPEAVVASVSAVHNAAVPETDDAQAETAEEKK